MNERDDAGLTLIELLVSAILFVTVGTLVTVSLDTFLNVSNLVHTSYANTQQILPVSTNVQRLIRSEVEPAPPTGTGAPVPPFLVGAVSTTSVTFYANVGVPGRPAKVVAGLTTATGTPSPTGTTFTVTDTLADANTCPLSVSSTATCTFNNNPAKRVASITNVINSTWPSVGSPTPVFTFTLLNSVGVQTTVAGSSVASTFGSTCTYSSNLVTTCPYDTVQGVEIDLMIRAPGSKLLAPAEDDTIVYRLSSTSYLYSPTVG